MAETGAGGWQAVTLPSTQPQYGETLQLGIQNSERQGEKFLQLAEQNQRRDEQQQLQNLRYINNVTDFDQYKTLEQHIDSYSQDELKKIMNNAIVNYSKLPPAEMEIRLQNDMQPFLKWDMAAKNSAATLNNNLTDFNKTYPNADYGKARQIAQNQFANDFLNPDGTRKNVDQIQPSDYSQYLQKPEVLGQIINDTTPFDKAIYGIPKEAVGGENYVNNKGQVVAHKWSGMKPTGDMGEYVYDSDNKPIGIKLAGTDIPAVKDANGQPMRILNDDMMKRLYANPSVSGSMEKMWQDARGNIEANYQKQTGQPLDQYTDDILKRAFLYQQANGLIGHDLKIEEIQKIPKPPVVNINTGLANTNIHDVYNDIHRIASAPDKVLGYDPQHPNVTKVSALPVDAQQILVNIAQKLNPKGIGDEEIGQDKLIINKNSDGTLSLYELQDNNQAKLITNLTETDVNLAGNKGVKATQKVLQQANQPQQSTGKKKIAGF